MITEDYVSFETAKLLKDKGFDEETRGYYPTKGDATGRLMFGSEYDHNHSQVQISAPTLQMAMKWLRKVHHLTIDIFHFRDWKVNIKTTDDYLKADYDNPELKPSETYEEAAESAIKYCLENLI